MVRRSRFVICPTTNSTDKVRDTFSLPLRIIISFKLFLVTFARRNIFSQILEKHLHKMFTKKRFCDESSENYVNNSATESDSGDVIRSVRKKCMRLVIDDTSDEDQLLRPWLWKGIRNNLKIWDYTMTPGIREAAWDRLVKLRTDLPNRGMARRLRDLVYIFGPNCWNVNRRLRG